MDGSDDSEGAPVSGGDELEPGTILEGRYGVVRFLRQGTTHRVYEGRQTNLGLSVILKTLSEVYEDPVQAKQQIEQVAIEARILAGLHHPNLLTVYDSFLYHGLPVLVSESIEGRRLQDVAELAPRPISQRRILTWAAQLLDVLAYLHGQEPPIIVRDLKPSNVILGRDGRLRIVDFSLAKRMTDAGKGTHEIVRGLGADGFAPLEQSAYSRTSPATDLYSLGATLYFLLTKTAPPAASMRAIAAKDPLLDPRLVNETVTEEVWKALQQMMVIRPQDRVQSVAQAKELLFPTPAAESAGRVCVDCAVRLDQHVRQGVEIDQCPSCGGIWLDRDELERLIELGQSVSEAESSPSAGNTPTLALEQSEFPKTVRLDDIELPPTSRVWQFLRDVLGPKR